MKLYGITVEFELLVAAENEDEAAELALENADEELRNMGDQPDISVYEITEAARIPKVWRGCLPYRHRRERGNPELTVEDVLLASAAPADGEKPS